MSTDQMELPSYKTEAHDGGLIGCSVFIGYLRKESLAIILTEGRRDKYVEPYREPSRFGDNLMVTGNTASIR